MRAYVPHAAQARFHRSTERFVNLCAGRRAGKSEAAGHEFLRRVVRDQADPNLRHWGEDRQYWACAPTESLTKIQLRKLTSAAQQYRIPLKPCAEGLQIPGWPVLISFRTTGSIAQLIADDVFGVWLDEAAKMRDYAWGYLEPALTATGGWVITSTTPEGMGWYYEEFWRKGDPEDECYDPRYANHTFFSSANPYLAWICPHCLESYRAFTPAWEARTCPADGTPLIHEAEHKRALLPARIYKREYEAAFGIFVGQIWEALSKDLHWGRAPELLRRQWAGQDWNYALPGVWLPIGEAPDGRLWVLEEIHQDRLPVWDEAGDCWVSRIKGRQEALRRSCLTPGQVIYADPSEPEHIETERRKGLNVRPAKNAVSLGLQTVETLLHPVPGVGPRLMFALDETGRRPRAFKTWQQCLGYRFKPGTEEPIKENDHGCDALRYALHTAVGHQVRQMGMGRFAR